MDITDIITEFLESTAWRMEAPKIGSTFHILSVIVLSLIAVAAAVKAASIGKGGRIRILFVLGLIMLATEIYKQLFYYYVVNGGTYDWWFFPFQLCSVPMYMCILLPLLHKTDLGKAMLTFMCGFTFVSAVAALIWPEDMLRPYAALTWHGLIWHGILLFISVMIGLSGMADLTRKGFMRSVLLFLVLCAIAIMINVLAEPIAASHPIYPGSVPGTGPAGGTGVITYPNMFYLSPYHASTQPVIRSIDASFGRIPAMLAYIIMIIAGAGLADAMFYKLGCAFRSGDDHQNP
ncbi:MAG: YwaF family protein [Eubacterium sp.]|nr:YwaF family protein [Eubacterium sp.]